MSTFKITRRELTLEFWIKTTAKATSFQGTQFAPNHCLVRVYDGEILSVTLDRVDENGWDIDDPAGPDGAVLAVSYGGGELAANARFRLPPVAQDALAEIEKAI